MKVKDVIAQLQNHDQESDFSYSEDNISES